MLARYISMYQLRFTVYTTRTRFHCELLGSTERRGIPRNTMLYLDEVSPHRALQRECMHKMIQNIDLGGRSNLMREELCISTACGFEAWLPAGSTGPHSNLSGGIFLVSSHKSRSFPLDALLLRRRECSLWHNSASRAS